MISSYDWCVASNVIRKDIYSCMRSDFPDTVKKRTGYSLVCCTTGLGPSSWIERRPISAQRMYFLYAIECRTNNEFVCTPHSRLPE